MPSVREIRFKQDLKRAFPDDAELIEDIQSTVTHHPDTIGIFHRIIERLERTTSEEPSRPSKRIKTEQESHAADRASSAATARRTDHKLESAESSTSPVLIINELSFVTPIRKKLTLHISEASISAVAPTDNTKIEVEVPLTDIRSIVLLPVPDKAARLSNFCIFRKSSDETIVFTVPDTAPKGVSGSALPTGETQSSFRSLISQVFEKVTGLVVVEPETQDFVSALPQPHRKQEPAVHITAHRGSKEGYLFFLSIGLIYGFKRPLLFVPLEDITSVTYNDILQRTFNLTVSSEMGEKAEEHEFSMIDTVEHDRVDKYIRKYKLNDQSLAESRKAKVVSQKGSTSHESEISKAADEIAAGVTGETKDETDEEGDEDFHDDESHGGSTIASDESDQDGSNVEDENGETPGASEDENSDENENDEEL